MKAVRAQAGQGLYLATASTWAACGSETSSASLAPPGFVCPILPRSQSPSPVQDFGCLPCVKPRILTPAPSPSKPRPKKVFKAPPSELEARACP